MLRTLWLMLLMGWAVGCSKAPAPAPVARADAAREQLLDDMQGVWRSTEPEQLFYLVRDGRNLRLLSEGVYETDVQLRSVDVQAQSANLSVAAAGGRVIWTLQKVAQDAAPGFGLRLTMNGGGQLDLALVRRISPEDREFMAGELARAIRETSGGDEVEVDADAAEDAPVADGDVEAASSDDEKVRKVRLADEGPGTGAPAAEAVVHPTSFDCDRAQVDAERLVCGDAGLADLDRKLARAYRAALKGSDQPEAERSTQMRWLADKRNACDTVACLDRAYRQRLKYFEGAPHYTYSEYAE